MEEDFKELKGLQGGGPSRMTAGEKKKLEDSKPTVATKRVKKQSTAKEIADYKATKTGERKVKKQGSVAPTGEVKHTVWAEAHHAVDQKVVDKPKWDNQCTRCRMKNDVWKYC